MTLGQKLKQLRLAKEMSQPELAQQICIEQSYLSKLENDKAFPSDEIFSQLLIALDIELDDFLQGFEQSVIQTQLCKIAQISRHQKQYETQSVNYMLRWIMLSSLLIVLGGTAWLAGEKKWIFDKVYLSGHVYESKGVIKVGEALRVFSGYKGDLPDEILARLSFQSKKMLQHSGDYFVEEVTENGVTGKRFYQRARKQRTSVTNQANNWLRVFAVFALLSGFVGLVIEHKIRKIRTNI
ncbi:MAG: helix-turn-helix transcriptional regulator [Psychrobium sp.]|nr:helix-turn-helix transcriptional regulator [Psychrobium sp.]